MISIEQVTKKFGDIRALDQVEAQIAKTVFSAWPGRTEQEKVRCCV